jgi:pimeloyl-ACP methyl ester carboxylesterase
MKREPRRLWSQSGNVRIEAVEWSPPGTTDEGLPMVFIPGGTGNAMFAEMHGEAAIAGRLGSRKRRVLGVSRRGTGRSDAPTAGYAPLRLR